MVAVTAHSRTIVNGTSNDGSVVESNMVELYNNDQTLATAVTNIENGQIVTGKTLTMRYGFAGSPTAATTTDNIRFKANRGSATSMDFGWSELNSWWDVTSDGTNYLPVSLVTASDPGTPIKGMRWFNSTSNTFKFYDGSNSRVVDSLSVVAKSGNYTALATDRGVCFVCTTSFTLTFTAAATLGTGWYCFVRNDGTGQITLSPNVDAIAMVLLPGESIMVYTDGSTFRSAGRARGLVLLATATASSSATVDFTANIDSNFEEYLIVGTRVSPATDDTAIEFRFSEDAGSTWKAGATDYVWTVGTHSSGGTAQAASAGDTNITLTRNGGGNGLGNTALKAFNFELRFYAPSNTTINKYVTVAYTFLSSGAALIETRGEGYYKGTTNAVTGARLLMSSGNIASGNFYLYGLRKA